LGVQIIAKGQSGGESSTGGKKAATVEQGAPPVNEAHGTPETTHGRKVTNRYFVIPTQVAAATE
jgi:hypothetical protein